MNSLAILVAAAGLGVDYGWHYTPDGHLEYLIQIEPGLVRSLETGIDVTSELMPEVRSVRRFRISVGTRRLPRETVVQASAESPRHGDGVKRGALSPPANEPDRVAPRDGRPIEQAAAKPTDSPGAAGESPSSEMNRLSADEKRAGAEASPADSSMSPWLVGSIVALCASLGANFYQGVNLKSARRRYYQLVDRLGIRAMPGSDGVTIEGYAK